MIRIEVKDMFFTSAAVVKKVGTAKRQILSRAGAMIRQTARQSMRRAKSPSMPGEPPHAHVGLLKKHLYFRYSRENGGTVVVGPIRLPGSRASVPSLLEHGGFTVQRAHFTLREKRRGKTRRATVLRPGTVLDYESRPYMGPALEKEMPKIPELWRNSVR